MWRKAAIASRAPLSEMRFSIFPLVTGTPMLAHIGILPLLQDWRWSSSWCVAGLCGLPFSVVGGALNRYRCFPGCGLGRPCACAAQPHACRCSPAALAAKNCTFSFVVCMHRCHRGPNPSLSRLSHEPEHEVPSWCLEGSERYVGWWHSTQARASEQRSKTSSPVEPAGTRNS